MFMAGLLFAVYMAIKWKAALKTISGGLMAGTAAVLFTLYLSGNRGASGGLLDTTFLPQKVERHQCIDCHLIFC